MLGQRPDQAKRDDLVGEPGTPVRPLGDAELGVQAQQVLLHRGLARWPLLRRIFSGKAFRDWLYHKARRGTGTANSGVIRPTQKTVVIGDALKPGKTRSAIASAFDAALLP